MENLPGTLKYDAKHLALDLEFELLLRHLIYLLKIFGH